ncbi:hypothetical protein Syun_025196 [Stephania yunnanensis]|uniref:B box-type domain-containing protein n=1 Tax=Stephania yunnanensis TaxID=152371 RepID=A0AAP0ER84_9MAGN
MRAIQSFCKDVLESDQASLCWVCDSKVHCANFLVARHFTSLQCHSCQSTEAKLEPMVSVCEWCMKGKEEVARVTEKESHDGNEIKALHESAMSSMAVHRGEVRAGGVGVRVVYEGERERLRISGGGEPLRGRREAAEESHSGNEIDQDDDDDSSGDSDGDDDDICDED